jgi:hypothetical protein
VIAAAIYGVTPELSVLTDTAWTRNSKFLLLSDNLWHILFESCCCKIIRIQIKQIPWPLIRQRNIRTQDRHLSANLVSTTAWLAQPSRYFLFPIAAQLSSRGWVNPVPDPLLLRKFGSAGNRTRDRRGVLIILTC